MEQTLLKRQLTIMDKALTLKPEKRIPYLNEMCGADSVLRNKAGHLLESIEESEFFWDGWKKWNAQQIAELFEGDSDPELQRTGAGEKDLSHDRQIGPWRLIRQLGRGGMGSVWLAERADQVYEQRAALKLLHRGYLYPKPAANVVRRFEQERQILAQLDHPNIACLYDGGMTNDGLPWLAMEYIDGQLLTEWCSQQKGSLKQRLDLFKEICEAIRYAHKNLIVHRDLKPENILVTKEGHIKILDFGIAKLLDDKSSADRRIQTQTGVRAMSLNYAAPEQITGEAVTTATDVYALGLLLYELLMDGYPYDLEDKNRRQIEQLIRDEEPVRPSAFRKGNGHTTEPNLSTGGWNDLDAIILKALRKEPEKRYANAGQLLADLHRFRGNQPILARRDTIQYRWGKWLHRHRWAATSGLITLFSLLMGIGVVMWPCC